MKKLMDEKINANKNVSTRRFSDVQKAICYYRKMISLNIFRNELKKCLAQTKKSD